MRKHALGLATALFIVLAASSTASAQPAGSMMANFRLGPAVSVSDYSNQLLLSFDFGAVISQGAKARVYFTIPVEFGVGSGFTAISGTPARTPRPRPRTPAAGRRRSYDRVSDGRD